MNSAEELTPMVEPPDVWRPVLDALIAAPIACQSPDDLAVALGLDVDEMTDRLSLMDEAGWIAVWDGEVGPIVTLTPLAAERLQVVLIERGPDETPRWARAGDPVPSPPKAKHVCHSERSASLDGLPDPALTPDLAAERAERAEGLAARAASRRTGPSTPFRVEDLPRPSMLLGQGLTPWPGPRQAPRDDCPACSDRVLLPHMYCLCCNRWGLDALLAALVHSSDPASPLTSSPSPPVFVAIPPDRLARHDQQEQYQFARERRKAKRQARRAAQAKQGRLRARN
jgi:hypothetical protein